MGERPKGNLPTQTAKVTMKSRGDKKDRKRRRGREGGTWRCTQQSNKKIGRSKGLGDTLNNQ